MIRSSINSLDLSTLLHFIWWKCNHSILAGWLVQIPALKEEEIECLDAANANKKGFCILVMVAESEGCQLPGLVPWTSRPLCCLWSPALCSPMNVMEWNACSHTVCNDKVLLAQTLFLMCLSVTHKKKSITKIKYINEHLTGNFSCANVSVQ